MRMRTLGLALLMLIVAAPAASASFPGRNGKIAVVQDDNCPEPPDDDPPRVIKAYSPGGASLGRLTKCDANRDGPDWSRRGARLAFAQTTGGPAEFWSQKADGTDLRSMKIPAEADFEGTEGPSWSPDGRRVAFVKDDAIWTAKTDGTGMKRVLARPCPHCVEILSARWSPNGRKIAFVASGAGKKGFRQGLWVVNRNGKHRRRLAKGGLEPDWSPNSKRIVYRSDYENKESGGATGGNLYVIRVKDGRKHRLLHTRSEVATVPVWAPNGKSVAYVELRFGAGDVGFDLKARLMRLSAKGGKPHRLHKLPDPPVDEGFFASPDIAWQARP
jgi:Tol biopolymer transport system component